MGLKQVHLHRDRSGVALILVIGMLALMMVMGVTFSIFMRTERLVAGNFRVDVQTRELLQVALARALDDLEYSVGTNVYPSWEILESSGSGLTNTAALSGAISNWIPWAALSGTNAAPMWIDLGSAGRVAYLVLNSSGFLDANYAGGGGRASGSNVTEIQLGTLPEVADATLLAANRPYATLQELGGKASGVLAAAPQSLVTYSAFPTNYTGGADLGLVDLSGDVEALKDAGRKTAIISALAKSGITDASFVYSNLLCYVDPSVLPLNPDDLGSPLTKSVPLINEVKVVITNFVYPGALCRPSVFVEVEWYYPFLKATPNAFDVACDVSVSLVAGAAKYLPVSLVNKKTPSNYSGVPVPPYKRVVFAASTAANVAYATNDPIHLAVSVGVKILRGGVPVDSVPYPYVTAGYFSKTGSVMTVPFNQNGGTFGWECFDPRFNWDTKAAAQQWAPYAPTASGGTIGQSNYWTTFYINNAPTRAVQYTEMYVAGEPLHNVGELSYLLRGFQRADKWSTVKICKDQRSIPVDKVLDNFVIQVSTNRKGLVNINTRSAEVLASVFSGLPLESYPGQSSPPATVNPAQAFAMAEAVKLESKSSISLLSDFWANTTLMTLPPVSGLTPLQSQAVIRNAAGLLHYRQNYFTVLLYAQPSGMTIDRLGLRAVAEVWRDPVASPGGSYPKFVRTFTIVNN